MRTDNRPASTESGRGLGRGARFERVVAPTRFDAPGDAEDDVGVGEHGEELELRATARTEQGRSVSRIRRSIRAQDWRRPQAGGALASADCLIQFSTPQADTLVDPLALPDLSPLAPVFADPAIEKVFHAAEYDLICLKRDYGFKFANLFDTMVAARLLGRKAVGLGSILEAEFEVHADKRNQRADWGKRPLDEGLLAYATLDTHYLIPLRDRLKRQLVEKGLWALAQEDFRRLCRTPMPVLDEEHMDVTFATVIIPWIGPGSSAVAVANWTAGRPLAPDTHPLSMPAMG